MTAKCAVNQFNYQMLLKAFTCVSVAQMGKHVSPKVMGLILRNTHTKKCINIIPCYLLSVLP